MYESYWRLESKPFENSSNPKYYYPSEAHQGALLKLRYAIESRLSAALLAGGSGMGKTLLAETLLRQLPEGFAPICRLVFPKMPSDQIVAYLADELSGGCAAAPLTLEQSVRRLEKTLIDNAKQERHAVVIIDEAHLLRDAGALETIRLLLNFEHQSRPPLTLLLAGQPAILPTLDRMPELDERLGVKCLLRPFTQEETFGYIGHRMQIAGAEEAVFDITALEAIHHHSQGIPRRINRLCDLALLIGYAEERVELSAPQIEAVAEELATVTPEGTPQAPPSTLSASKPADQPASFAH